MQLDKSLLWVPKKDYRKELAYLHKRRSAVIEAIACLERPVTV